MSRQLISVVHQANSVVILINGVDARAYNKDQKKFQDLKKDKIAEMIRAGVAEHEEIVEGNVVHSWMWVPTLICGARQTTKVASNGKYHKNKARKNALIAKKDARVEMYAKMVAEAEAAGEEIELWGDDEAFRDNAELNKMQNRHTKQMNFTKDIPVSMLAGEDFYENEHYPDADVGINKKDLRPLDYDPTYTRTFREI